jgi:hypothetical protein
MGPTAPGYSGNVIRTDEVQQTVRPAPDVSVDVNRNDDAQQTGATMVVPVVPDELDQALREASDYINQNVPAGSKIAILNVQSASSALSDYIIDELIANAVNDKVFIVIDRQQLNLIRGELDFQYSDDVDDDSAQSIGKLIGAEVIVSGAVGKYGDMYRMRIRALAVQTAQVQGQFNRNIPEGRTIAALMTSAAVGYSTGTAPAARQTTQVPATPTPAPAGTVAPAATAAPGEPPAAPATSVTPVTYKIGDTGPTGGLVFYDKGVVTNGWRYLEAAPNDVGPTQWGAYGTSVGGTSTAAGTGKANTQRIVPTLEQREEDGAALLCSMLNINGYTGWFLPSRDELDLMYKNLKVKGLGGFGNGFYWSSSEYSDPWNSSDNTASIQRFSDGNQDKNRKTETYSVRAIRAF